MNENIKRWLYENMKGTRVKSYHKCNKRKQKLVFDVWITRLKVLILFSSLCKLSDSKPLHLSDVFRSHWKFSIVKYIISWHYYFRPSKPSRQAKRSWSAASNISPGMTDIVFSARRTLNALRADTLPRSTNSVTYLKHGGWGNTGRSRCGVAVWVKGHADVVPKCVLWDYYNRFLL